MDEAVKVAHIDNINQKYKREIIKPEEPVKEEKQDLVCPRCGSALVLRIAKKGENAGKQFYGCSSFPKCKYIQNV